MEKKSLFSFYNNLNNDDKILFASTLSSFIKQNDDKKISLLQQQLKKIINKINKVNEEREYLSKKHNRLKTIYKKLNSYNTDDLLFQTIKLVVFSTMNEIKKNIAETRPNDLLKEKFELNNLIIYTKQHCLITEQAMKVINDRN